MVECTCFFTHRPTVTLQLHNFDLFRTCGTSSFCTVAWQLARFQLTRCIARSLGDSGASCLHSPSTASGACYRRSACTGTCWGLRQRLVATWAEFQHSMVYYATDQCRKRPEACINAEAGHSEQQVWSHCLPDIPVATHRNRFFSEPPMTTHNWLFSGSPTFERMQQTFNQI